MSMQKRYYSSNTYEELRMGDTIELTLSKEIAKGITHYESVELEINKETIPTLLKAGAIVEVNNEFLN